MTAEREEQARRSKARARGASATRIVYGSLLVAIGACVGIVIGSVSETPRLLLERLRGPVATVDLEAPAADAPPKASPPLEAFGELQKGTPPPAPAVSSAPPAPAAKPAAPPPAAKPAAPPPAAKPAAPPPAAKPAAAAPKPAAAPASKSPEELMRGLEQKTAAAPAPGAANAHSVVQVLSLAERAQADALVTRLKSQGFQPYVVPMPDKSGRYRVRVRPDAGQSVAELEQKLRVLGLKTWITAE